MLRLGDFCYFIFKFTIFFPLSFLFSCWAIQRGFLFVWLVINPLCLLFLCRDFYLFATMLYFSFVSSILVITYQSIFVILGLKSCSDNSSICVILVLVSIDCHFLIKLIFFWFLLFQVIFKHTCRFGILCCETLDLSQILCFTRPPFKLGWWGEVGATSSLLGRGRSPVLYSTSFDTRAVDRFLIIAREWGKFWLSSRLLQYHAGWKGQRCFGTAYHWLLPTQTLWWENQGWREGWPHYTWEMVEFLVLQ